MTVSISMSVGDWNKGCKNREIDVTTVQELLETVAAKKDKPQYHPGAIDGLIARPPKTSSTVKAIVAFQRSFMSSPDGRVDPGGKTLQKLNEIANQDDKKTVPTPVGGFAGMHFPLARVPNLSYKTGGRRYGARRSQGTRKHAGCDLIVPEGTKIYAVDSGEIVRGPYHFYRGTYAIEVRHPKFVVRYCEIKSVASGLSRNSTVPKGQLIAYVGKMYVDSMLHFKMYDGIATGPLTQRKNPDSNGFCGW